MIRKQIAILITAALIGVTLAFPSATSGQNTVDTQIEKTRLQVQKLRADSGKKVEVRFKDKSKVIGYIMEAHQDSFILSDPKTGATQTVAYSEVAQVKKSGGSSMKPWLILGAVVAGVGITWAIVKPAVCDGGAQTRGIC